MTTIGKTHTSSLDQLEKYSLTYGILKVWRFFLKVLNLRRRLIHFRNVINVSAVFARVDLTAIRKICTTVKTVCGYYSQNAYLASWFQKLAWVPTCCFLSQQGSSRTVRPSVWWTFSLKFIAYKWVDRTDYPPDIRASFIIIIIRF